MAAVAVAGLIGMTASCAGADDTEAKSADAPAPAGPVTGENADVTVSGKGMNGGCEAVRKIFVALEGGDKAAAETLKTKADALFEEVAATEATKDIGLATDGATMAADLGFSLPDGPIYQSTLAADYRSICVAKHQAAALPA
ncbi:hypothetical protein GCM10020358_13330 [Amorphoplanes nipponensis]|uniref:Lipoprotein n=2 Tax=Actinoplanes nipponensis TaxID=135950 RepID=A0A919MQH5_9ACTN|nr:hypothetical protein Ani05nite_40870 [Actinoplanes nipponensis]